MANLTKMLFASGNRGNTGDAQVILKVGAFLCFFNLSGTSLAHTYTHLALQCQDNQLVNHLVFTRFRSLVSDAGGYFNLVISFQRLPSPSKYLVPLAAIDCGGGAEGPAAAGVEQEEQEQEYEKTPETDFSQYQPVASFTTTPTTSASPSAPSTPPVSSISCVSLSASSSSSHIYQL